MTEDKKLDAEGVRAALDVKNLTDPGQMDIVRVTGADGEYVITGITPEIENNSSMAVPGLRTVVHIELHSRIRDLILKSAGHGKGVQLYNS